MESTRAPNPSTGSSTVENQSPPSLLRRLNLFLDRHRRWVCLVIFILYLGAYTGQWILGPDTALFAKSFMWPLLLLNHLLVLGILCLSFLLFKKVEDRPVAVLITMLLAVNFTFFRHANLLLADIPFMFGMMMLLLGVELLNDREPSRVKGAVAMIGIGMLIMALFRFVVMIPACALFIALIVHAIRNRIDKSHKHSYWRLVGIGAIVVVTLLVIRFSDPRNDQSYISDEREVIQALTHNLPDTASKALTINIPNLLVDKTPQAMFGNKLGILPINIAVSVFLFIGAILLWRKHLFWSLLVAGFVLQWCLFLPGVRYFLPILPILIYGWYRSASWIEQRVPKSWGPVVAVGMIIGLVGMNFGRVAATVGEQRFRSFSGQAPDGRYLMIPEFGQLIKQKTADDAWIICSVKWVEPIGFFSRRRVVPIDKRHQAISSGQSAYLVETTGQEIEEALRLRLEDPIIVIKSDGMQIKLRRIKVRPSSSKTSND
jgi:MFS family permease